MLGWMGDFKGGFAPGPGCVFVGFHFDVGEAVGFEFVAEKLGCQFFAFGAAKSRAKVVTQDFEVVHHFS